MGSKKADNDYEWNKTKHRQTKHKFTEEEDKRLISIIKEIGTDWKQVSLQMKTRNPRQCRERWNNYINPSLSDAPWTHEEDKLLIELHKKYGTAWNKIGKHFKNRSDNSLRNRFMRMKRQKIKLHHKNVDYSDEEYTSDDFDSDDLLEMNEERPQKETKEVKKIKPICYTPPAASIPESTEKLLDSLFRVPETVDIFADDSTLFF